MKKRNNVFQKILTRKICFLYFSISKKYTYLKLEEIKDVVKNVNYQPKSLLEALYQGDKSANSAVLMVAGLLIGANDTVFSLKTFQIPNLASTKLC